MKTNYTCEKCGKTFDNWDDAYLCEDSHLRPVWDITTPELVERMVYSDGRQIPDVLIIPFEERKDGETITHYVTFKQVKELNGLAVEQINSDIEKRKAQEEISREAWRKEVEERKAREAQAE